MATKCAGVRPEACRRRCKPAAILTLAYVLSECRVDAAGLTVGRQALRIRRGDREPITVVEFGPGEPVPDPRFCRNYGALRQGADSVRVFPLQRLGVSPDGSAVVFEVNDAFSISPHTPLSPGQRGFFMVRSDGSGLRPLGPASRAQSFSDDTSPPIAFSPNGRRIAFTDLGPGPGDEEAVQIVVLDLATGKRTQVTRLPSGTPPSPPDPVDGGSFFLTCCPRFIDNETVVFQTYVDPDGSNPGHTFAGFTVRIDGSGLKPVPIPTLVAGSEVIPSFAVGGGRGTSLLRLSLPGTPVKHRPFGDFPITEVFVRDGEDLRQLTNFRCQDTVAAFLNAARTRAFFLASADPLGTNSNENCQLFSVGVLGGARSLRQVTHFDSPARTIGPACAGVGSAFPGLPDRKRVLPCRPSGPGDEGHRLQFHLRSLPREPLRRADLRHAPRRRRAPPADRRFRNDGQPGWRHQGRASRPVRLLGCTPLIEAASRGQMFRRAAHISRCEDQRVGRRPHFGRSHRSGWTKEGRHAERQMPTSPENLRPRVAERCVARHRIETLMRSLATDSGGRAPVEHGLRGQPARRRTRERLTRDDVWRLLELATGVEPSAALVAALHEASRGNAEPAAALLRELLAAGPGRVSLEEYMFRREGEYWTIAYESRVIRLHESNGLRYLARLLRQPGQPVPVTELAERGAGAGDHASLERARLAVTKAIRIALAHIAAAHPGLGQHLGATVRRGYSCVYLPDPRTPIAWTE